MFTIYDFLEKVSTVSYLLIGSDYDCTFFDLTQFDSKEDIFSFLHSHGWDIKIKDFRLYQDLGKSLVLSILDWEF